MMLWKMYFLSTMAILGIYVRFQGCKFSIGKKQLVDFRFARGPTSQLDADKEEEAEEVPPHFFH